MFDNIGGKLKTIALTAAIINMIVFAIGGIVLIFIESFWMGLLFIVLGVLVSWLESTTLYGFGELIEATVQNKDYLKKIADSMERQEKERAADSMNKKESPAQDTIKSVQTINGWICKNCSTWNEDANQFCKMCNRNRNI